MRRLADSIQAPLPDRPGTPADLEGPSPLVQIVFWILDHLPWILGAACAIVVAYLLFRGAIRLAGVGVKTVRPKLSSWRELALPLAILALVVSGLALYLAIDGRQEQAGPWLYRSGYQGVLVRVHKETGETWVLYGNEWKRAEDPRRR